MSPETQQVFESLPDGTEVQHKTHGYKGKIAGTTKIKRLFEAPDSAEEYRIKVSESEIKIASRTNLVCLKKPRIPDKTEELIVKHKNFLSEMGIAYQGTRKAGQKLHRVAHCWKCATLLDSKLDVECIACGWILCSCGACGCWHEKKINLSQNVI